MAQYPLFADSKHLPGPAFDPFVIHMSEAEQRLESLGEPPTVTPRSPLDVVVNLVVPEGVDVLTVITQGLEDLPQGDAKRVRELAKLIEAAEAAATETAANAFGPHHGHNV